jgi:hypothetical protein
LQTGGSYAEEALLLNEDGNPRQLSFGREFRGVARLPSDRPARDG